MENILNNKLFNENEGYLAEQKEDKKLLEEE